jgi:hypothetical protein
MIAPILTFLSTRIVYVFITTVVVIAAVPTLIVAIHGNTITITSSPVASASRQHGDDARARIIVQVKTAGDDAIVKLTNEEANCDSQIAQLASVSKLSGTATQAAIAKGKGEFHNDELPFINEIKADEDELANLSTVTTTTEQTFLVRINTVEVTALGANGSSGALVTVCQTVIVEIRQIVIVVQVPPSTGGGDDEGDIRTKV